MGARDHDADWQRRWEAFRAAARDLAASTRDTDPAAFGAAFAALRQAGGGLDDQDILNTPHQPQDAGEHADALAGMLARIPDGWGRWISCARGWYPLLVQLDLALSTLFPDGYQIHQIKEKQGILHFYWDVSMDSDDPTRAADLKRRHQLATQIVAAVERRSAQICEQCGVAGRRHQTATAWYRTLCDSCAAADGRYTPVDE